MKTQCTDSVAVISGHPQDDFWIVGVSQEASTDFHDSPPGCARKCSRCDTPGLPYKNYPQMGFRWPNLVLLSSADLVMTSQP